MNERRYRGRMASMLAIIAVAMMLHADPLAAQYPAPVGLKSPALPIEIARGGTVSNARPPANPIDAARVAHGVLVGAGVGAAVGIVVVAATPHSSHEEDALGYIVGAAMGAFVGMLVGGVIGASR